MPKKSSKPPAGVPPMIDSARMLAWLESKHATEERAARTLAREQRYGEAAKALGRAEGYAFTLVWLRSEVGWRTRGGT